MVRHFLGPVVFLFGLGSHRGGDGGGVARAGRRHRAVVGLVYLAVGASGPTIPPDCSLVKSDGSILGCTRTIPTEVSVRLRGLLRRSLSILFRCVVGSGASGRVRRVAGCFLAVIICDPAKVRRCECAQGLCLLPLPILRRDPRRAAWQEETGVGAASGARQGAPVASTSGCRGTGGTKGKWRQ